jgi:hypothetical protein
MICRPRTSGRPHAHNTFTMRRCSPTQIMLLSSYFWVRASLIGDSHHFILLYTSIMVSIRLLQQTQQPRKFCVCRFVYWIIFVLSSVILKDQFARSFFKPAFCKARNNICWIRTLHTGTVWKLFTQSTTKPIQITRSHVQHAGTVVLNYEIKHFGFCVSELCNRTMKTKLT